MRPLKKKTIPLLAVPVVLLCLLCALGVGPYWSSAAAHDLSEQLAAIHGEPYVLETENGTERLEFTIESDSFFLTNRNLRSFFNWDYHSTCTVTYTAHSVDGSLYTQTTTYKAVDPMGYDEMYDRAYIDVESAVTRGQSSQP